ncbi:MAG: hypothetical protein HYT39_04210 [Candidatus Sungbacteria bacterium]|nr:hypothetical protein [Candidatus Sungbacteria bacterium]
MKIVDGFVWVAEDKTTGYHAIFAKNTSPGQAHYESLESNGITPFSSAGAAMAAFEYLGQRRDLKKFRLAHLRLEIAEWESDFEKIKSSPGKRWIVIVQLQQFAFLGSRTEGRPSAYPLPGAFLWANQLQPFKLFTAAESTAQQAHRQGGGPTTIATFNLEIIKRL